MDYFRFGRGDRSLVIIPGISVQSVMASADLVADAYKSLADDFTIYVVDRRKDPPKGYTVYDMAEDTAEAIRAMGIERTSILGASQGGMIGMVIAIRYPELVEKLVLASTTAYMTGEEYRKIEEWERFAERGDATGLYLSFGEAVYPSEVFEQSRDALTDAAKTVTEEELKNFLIIAEGMRGFDITKDLHLIRCPVLVVGDMQDRVLGAGAVSSIGNYMNEENDFRCYMYDGYGHGLYDTAPDFKDRILGFLLDK